MEKTNINYKGNIEKPLDRPVFLVIFGTNGQNPYANVF